ncbi:3-dehydroquinate synthase [Peptoniphilus sp. ING2-D1G]|nr:3-dehydroquinate synthase [Peptoniphilus sp. ING2-D1G]
MTKVQINTGFSYSVLIEKGLFQKIGPLLKNEIKGKALVLTDERVGNLYADLILKQLKESEIQGDIYRVKEGEDSKSLCVYGEILEYMAANNYHRNDTLISLGGGVIGDLGGFVAATFQRGMEYIQMPTSLLAAVDSSVGGKTALNLREGKNLVGAFKQPLAVYCDPEVFKSMERERFADGVAESIKYGILFDRDLFNLFKSPLTKEDERLEELVEKAVKHKAEVVARDEFEKDERKLLNLGHTIGHSIERASGFKITHGHAVAIGMAVMAKACSKRQILKETERDEILEVLKKNDLPTDTSFSVEVLFEHIYKDKKSDGKNITIVEIEEIGKCRLKKIPLLSFKEYIEEGIDDCRDCS